MKTNSVDFYDSILVTLNKEKTPIAFEQKVQELLEQGVFPTREKAEEYVNSTPIELELYYQKHSGLFSVETEAVESGTIYSPYSAELLDPYYEE